MFKITHIITSASRLFIAVTFSFFITVMAKPAFSDESFVRAGERAVNAGQYNKAINHLTKAIETGSLSPQLSAKAFYFRGLAYSNKNEPARSIADFTSALFFKKNSASLKSKILVARARAYRAVGLVNRAENDIRASGRAETTIASVKRPVQTTSAQAPIRRKAPSAFDTIPTRSYSQQKTKPVTQGWGASVDQTSQQRNNGYRQQARSVQNKSNNYRSWFDAPKPRQNTVNPVQRNNNYQTNRQVPPTRRVALSNSPSSRNFNSNRSGSGRYRLQLAAVSSENDARAAWARLVSQHSSLLSNQSPDFQTVNLGGSKSVVRIQIGPFADKIQTLQLCNRFKQSGLDCFLVVR